MHSPWFSTPTCRTCDQPGQGRLRRIGSSRPCWSAISLCLEVLEAAAGDPAQAPRITIGLSPTLLSLLSDQDLIQRFPGWLNARLDLLPLADPALSEGADHLAERIRQQRQAWADCGGDLIQRFAALQRIGVVDLLTCGATHGYLPAAASSPGSGARAN